MIDGNKMVKPDFAPEIGEFAAVCATLHHAAEVIQTADRVPDETVKAPLLDGAKIMLQNVIDALNGRRTDGLVQPEAETEEDE